MIIIMYILLGVLVVLGVLSMVGAFYTHDLLMVAITLLLCLASLLLFFEIRKMQQDPFDH